MVIYIERAALHQLKDLPPGSVELLVVIDPEFDFTNTWRIAQRTKRLLAAGGSLLVAKSYAQAFEIL